MSFQDFGDYERLLRNDGSTYETELYISSPSFPDPFQGGAAEVNSDTASLWRLGPEANGRSVSRSLRVQVRPRGSLDVLGMELSGNVSNRLLRAIARATYEGTNLNFNVRANTGRLYSIQSGLDLNGDQSTRDRPPGVSRNTEVGPGGWNTNMTFTKEYRLGGSGAAPGGEDEEGAALLAVRPAPHPLPGAHQQPAQPRAASQLCQRADLTALRAADRLHGCAHREPLDESGFLTCSAQSRPQQASDSYPHAAHPPEPAALHVPNGLGCMHELRLELGHLVCVPSAGGKDFCREAIALVQEFADSGAVVGDWFGGAIRLAGRASH